MVDLLSKVFAEVENHRGRASSTDTLIRLVEKQALARFRDPFRRALESGTVRVSAQEWHVGDLEALWSQNEAGAPQRDEGPIIVLRIGGVDMLVDGHNRRHKRLRDRDRATQAVLLMEVD